MSSCGDSSLEDVEVRALTPVEDPDFAVAHAVLAEYEVPPAEVRAIRLSNNSVYSVSPTASAAERLVLRVHRPNYRTTTQVEAELALLERIAVDGRVRAPRPVRTTDGRLVAELRDGSGIRSCDLLTWVEGRVLRPTMGLGQSGVTELGRTLGCLHNALAASDQMAAGCLPRWHASVLFTEESPFRPGPLSKVFDSSQLLLIRDVASRTEEVFRELDKVSGSFGIIHFDFILLNCRMRRRAGEWDVGVIDFDDCGWGYFLYDLAAIVGNLADFPGHPRMRDTFLAGYREVRDLPDSAEANLPLLMAARHVVSALCFAGRERAKPDSVAEHVAYRVDQARACLALDS